MTPFLVALQFLTRIPVSLAAAPAEREIANSVIFYPLVGIIVGALMVICAWLLSDFQPLLLAAIMVSVWVLISGGMHLDGLADSADAWAGGLGDKDKTLQIMKDPRSGPAAVVALVLVLLLKFSALAALLPLGSMFCLLIPPMLARAAVPLLFFTTPYVRQDGLGSSIAAQFPKNYSVLSVVISVVMVFVLAGSGTWIIVLVFVVSFLILRCLMLNRIGGATGDTIGAMIEIIETMILISLVAVI